MRTYSENIVSPITTTSLPYAKRTGSLTPSFNGSGWVELTIGNLLDRGSDGLFSFVSDNYSGNYAISMQVKITGTSNLIFTSYCYGMSRIHPGIACNGAGQWSLVSTMDPNSETISGAGFNGQVLNTHTGYLRICFIKKFDAAHPTQSSIACVVQDSNNVIHSSLWTTDLDTYARNSLGVSTARSTSSTITIVEPYTVYDQLTDVQAETIRHNGPANFQTQPTTPQPPNIYPTTNSYSQASWVYVTTYTGLPIYYTLDGSDPSKTSTLLSGSQVQIGNPFVLGQVVLKTRTYNSSTDTYSAVAEGTYTLTLSPPSVYQDSYTTDCLVYMTTGVSGAEIRYTLDGSTPTRTSTLYTAPLAYTWRNTDTDPYPTIQATVYTTTDESSAVMFDVSLYIADPVLVGVTSTVVNVYDNLIQEVTCETPASVIRYTLDGTVPTDASPILPGNTLNLPWIKGQIQATFQAFVGTTAAFQQASVLYVFDISNIVISPDSSVISTPVQVSLSCSTPGTVIRYTLDNSLPVPTSTSYLAPISVSPGSVLKAYAFKGSDKSTIASAVYDYEYLASKPTVFSSGTGIGIVYEKTQNQIPGWPLAPSEVLATPLLLDTNNVVGSSAAPAYMFWNIPDAQGQTLQQGFTNLIGNLFIKYDDEMSTLSMFCGSGNPELTVGFQNNQSFRNTIKNNAIGSDIQDSRLILRAVSGTGIAQAWLENRSGNVTLVLETLGFTGNLLETTSVLAPTTDQYCFLRLESSSTGIRACIAYNFGGNVPVNYTKTAELGFEDSDVGYELFHERSNTLSNTDTLSLIGFYATATSSKFMREPTGIVVSAYTQKQCGALSKRWELDNIDLGVFDTASSLAPYALAQSDRVRGGFVMGFVVAEYLTLSTHRVTGNHDVEIACDFAYGATRKNYQNQHVVAVNFDNGANTYGFIYLFNAGELSKIYCIVNSNNIGIIDIDYLNQPQSIVFGVGITGTNFTGTVEMAGGSKSVFTAVLNATSNPTTVSVTTNASEPQQLKSASQVVVKYIDVQSQGFVTYTPDLAVTVNGYYGVKNNVGFKYTSSILALPANTVGKIVCDLQTKALSVKSNTYHVNQTQDLLVGLFRTHATGLYEYAPCLVGSCICKKNVTWTGDVGAEEYILGVGSNPNHHAGTIAFDSAGDVIEVPDTTTTPMMPYYSYRGYNSTATKPPRRLRSIAHAPIKLSFHAGVTG